MIKVIYPQGCYGNYLAKSIYYHTCLSDENSLIFEFDSVGSSHDFRSNLQAHQLISCEHFLHEPPGLTDKDQAVVILPVVDHLLDYYNNQFIKQECSEIIRYISTQVKPQDAFAILQENWDYHGPFDETIPRWILREWFSFWIQPCLDFGYDATRYQQLPARFKLTSNDLFENFLPTFTSLVDSLGLTIKVSTDTISGTHQRFLEAQKMHGSQIKCQHWATAVLENTENVVLDLQTIFEESYIQHYLRTKGWEIECDSLENFPTDSITMKNLIYETS